MDLKFMERVWWVFSQLFNMGLVYKGFKEVSDPEIMVAFPIIDDPDGAAFVAWTTTPWTLPSNLALCVNANFVYVKDSQHSMIDDSEIIVDYNRQQLMPGWIPRRLGGGLSGKKESGQLHFGGQEKPFRAPIRPIPLDDLKRLHIPPPPEGRYMSRFQVPSPPRRKRSYVDREERSHKHHKHAKYSHQHEKRRSISWDHSSAD